MAERRAGIAADAVAVRPHAAGGEHGTTPGEDPRRVLGRRGEQLAAEYLDSLGLVVLSRNWRCREGEIDIVATDGIDRVYFCEVKTRSGEGFGTPGEAVTPGKRRRLRRLALIWLSEHRIRSWKAMQFDVISVLWPPGGAPELRHLPDAF